MVIIVLLFMWYGMVVARNMIGIAILTNILYNLIHNT